MYVAVINANLICCNSQPGWLFITVWCYNSVVHAIVFPSFHPSVTSRHCTKMAKFRITQTTPYDSPATQVFLCQKSLRNSNVVTPYGVR